MHPTEFDWTDPDIDVDWEVEHGDLDAGGDTPVSDAYLLYRHLPPNHPVKQKVKSHFPDGFDADNDDEYDQMVQWAVHYTLLAIKPTDFSIREATAYVLAQNPEITWDDAAEQMDVASGTFRAKMSKEVNSKLETAEATTDFAKRLDSTWASHQSYKDYIENPPPEDEVIDMRE